MTDDSPLATGIKQAVEAQHANGAALRALCLSGSDAETRRALCLIDGHIYEYSHTVRGADVMMCTTCAHVVHDPKVVWYRALAEVA